MPLATPPRIVAFAFGFGFDFDFDFAFDVACFEVGFALAGLEVLVVRFADALRPASFAAWFTGFFGAVARLRVEVFVAAALAIR